MHPSSTSPEVGAAASSPQNHVPDTVAAPACALDAMFEDSTLLRGIVDSTGDVIYAKDSNGRMRFANPAALKLIGKPLDQVLGKTDAEFLDDKDAGLAIMVNDRRIMETGQPEDLEERITLADGNASIWLSRKAPWRDPAGRVIGLIGISRDITAMKRESDQLTRLYSIAAALSETLTPGDVARVAVRQGIALFGATAGSLALVKEDGKSLEMCGSSGYPQEVIAQWDRFTIDTPIPLARAVRSGEPVFIASPEERLAMFPNVAAELKTHSEFQSAACIPLIIGGRTVGSLVFSFQHTGAFTAHQREMLASLARHCAQALDRARLFEAEQRARAEAQRAEADTRELVDRFERQSRLFERIASSTPDFIYVFDLQGRFLYANRRLLEVWGITADQALGKSLYELGYPDWHAAMHLRELAQVLETKQPIRGEVPFTGGSGISGVYEYIFTPVLDPEGNVEAVAGTTRDVSQRKRAEAEREKLLAGEKAARAEADRSSRMKDEFLATLSHELRTPLNAILGWATILSTSTPDQEELRDGLETIQRNARAQTQIIEDLLDMSRIVNGKVRLEVQPTDLAAVLSAAMDTVRPAAQAKGVKLRSVLDPRAGPVSGDAGRLQQVFWNLLNNAVKFTPRGGQVQVLLECVDSHVQVSVADTGEGISADFLPNVFDRFRQADASTTRRHGGLGLGLAIVKQLVELHGGTVRVKSPGPGQGSTFIVMLPLTVLHPEVEPDVLNRRHPRATMLDASLPDLDPRRLTGVNVVIVDDELDARALVTRLLERCGAAVRTASTAEEVMGLIAEKKPDVLVSDIGMPREDGYALIRRIRSLAPDHGGNIPALALTAYARTEDRIKAVQAGFQTHVAKPVEPAELITMVASLAGRNG